MFTGIIQDLGTIETLEKTDKDIHIVVKTNQLNMASVAIGDSIAVNGVCLTVVAKTADTFSADISNESCEKTSFKSVSTGDCVNLEKALTLADPIGGHLVSGHVDGVGYLVKKENDGKSTRYYFAAPDNLMRYFAPKGSVTVSGISLTVNHVHDSDNQGESGFDVSIIPHTEEATNISKLNIGDPVNLEIDLLARYLERMLQKDSSLTGQS